MNATDARQPLHVNGIAVPRIGLGTFGMDSAAAAELVERAIGVGYRHVDTAQRYENERGVGEGVRASGIDREQMFLATKIAHHDAPRALAPDAVRRSLAALGVDYLDLVYLHWPHPEIRPEETFEALLPLVNEGVVRGLGVSNFPSALVRRTLRVAPLVANQVERHTYLQQPVLAALAEETGTCLTAYAPFAEGRVFRDPVLQSIGDKHGAGAGQVALSWLLEQPRTVVIPKTQTPSRLEQNLRSAEVFLDDEDRTRIAALGSPSQRFFDPTWAPHWDD